MLHQIVHIARLLPGQMGTGGGNCTHKLLYQKYLEPPSGISWRAGRGGEVAADTIRHKASLRMGLLAGWGRPELVRFGEGLAGFCSVAASLQGESKTCT
jgi:hypothetical protein